MSTLTGANNNPAMVTPDGRLTVQALSELDNAIRKNSQMTAVAYAQVTNAADTNDNGHITIKNTDTMRNLVVDKIVIVTSAAALFTVKKGQAYASGGTGSAISSLNLGNSANPYVESYYGDNLTMSGTATTMMAKYAAAAGEVVFDVPIIIPPGMTLLVCGKGDAGSEVIDYAIIAHSEGV